jgi:hypothetical protein
MNTTGIDWLDTLLEEAYSNKARSMRINQNNDEQVAVNQKGWYEIWQFDRKIGRENEVVYHACVSDAAEAIKWATYFKGGIEPVHYPGVFEVMPYTEKWLLFGGETGAPFMFGYFDRSDPTRVDRVIGIIVPLSNGDFLIREFR